MTTNSDETDVFFFFPFPVVGYVSITENIKRNKTSQSTYQTKDLPQNNSIHL